MGNLFQRYFANYQSRSRDNVTFQVFFTPNMIHISNQEHTVACIRYLGVLFHPGRLYIDFERY